MATGIRITKPTLLTGLMGEAITAVAIGMSKTKYIVHLVPFYNEETDKMGIKGLYGRLEKTGNARLDSPEKLNSITINGDSAVCGDIGEVSSVFSRIKRGLAYGTATVILTLSERNLTIQTEKVEGNKITK